MIAIAYMYNRNGMASWCYEAAHALSEAGQDVLLVCAAEVIVSPEPGVSVVRFNPPICPVSGTGRKVLNELGRLVPGTNKLLKHLHTHLTELGMIPSVYLLNSSDFLDASVPVPQTVVGWAYPAHFHGYLKKIGIYGGWRLSRAGLRSFMDTVGWYFKDWYAYRRAFRVLAVSKLLNKELKRRGVRSITVHPGTALDSVARIARSGIPRLLIAAADLGDPRKRVEWMLSNLANDTRREYQLTLVGEAPENLKILCDTNRLPCVFEGVVSRRRVKELMAEHDLFLFGSCLDDWGYVLIEAMSAGMAVIAADLSPFDEIVGDAGQLYRWDSTTAFVTSVFSTLEGDLASTQRAAYQRAMQLFSRSAFAAAILQGLGRPDDGPIVDEDA